MDSNYKVLVVDDQARNLQLLKSVLQQQKYTIETASNGSMALKKVEKFQPDLILLDVMMDEMSGLEVCAKLKSQEQTRDIPVLFLTGATETQDIAKGFEVGGVDYIAKPVNFVELLSRLRTHLELKSAKDQLRRQNRELKDLNAAKNRFFSVVAHDLKGPFAIFLNLTSMLSLYSSSDNMEKFVEFSQKVDEAANRIYSLLQNLLEWSRCQMNQVEVKLQSIDLQVVVIENIEYLESQIQSKELVVNNCVFLPTRVWADPHMIGAVVRNILSNAIKFTPRCKTITLDVKQENNFHILEVRDEGVGIEKSNLENIFTMDKAISTNGTEDEKGTGLGLLLCKEFLNQCGGDITIESELDVGTSFFIKLPRPDSDSRQWP